MSKILRLLISVAVCQAAGFLGSIFTAPAIGGWYADLAKPSFNPPNWIFAPVWTILFLMMGIALYFVWSKGFKEKKVQIAIIIFSVQLVLNIFWSILFFGFKTPMLAFYEIIVLWLAILLNIIYFYKINKIAGLILVPYFLWVSFAGFLNYSLYLLNK